ncbi:DUF1697 domain-containing protein [Marasmitruncus massiliensis]|uniref:DUF1697 domain-containing protein n=1 Tax=Marasmitruncus massiliensis TaxID=1944642 RepID=UPI000C7B18ED|nr:DUF1697 domain-containing protein [Marasmitruncus massiliensis]MBE6906817.1 DUF1697 domain-containing protein [Oscillospiraceae bacterium]
MKYTLLFRGINVGGKNVVKMNDLKQLLLELGLSKVKTYIQSGNAVFETTLGEPVLHDIIRTGFINRFGFESDTLIRNIDEMQLLIEQFPITTAEIAAAEAADPQVEHLYVYFLNNPPQQTQIDAICKEYVGTDTLRAGKREMYLLCYQSIRKSKLAARTSKTFDSATVRNWKTVNKLYDMMIAL